MSEENGLSDEAVEHLSRILFAAVSLHALRSNDRHEAPSVCAEIARADADLLVRELKKKVTYFGDSEPER